MSALLTIPWYQLSPVVSVCAEGTVPKAMRDQIYDILVPFLWVHTQPSSIHHHI